MKIKVDEPGSRIDIFLSQNLEFSRSKIQKMLNKDLIKVNGLTVKTSYTVKENDEIEVGVFEEVNEDLVPRDIPLDIIYEDDKLLVVNKQNGLVVHPGAGNRDFTMANALVYHFDELSEPISNRPGIVHRIDAYTTGLLVVAKNDEVHAFLTDQISKRKMERKYLALVWGKIENDTGTIDAPIGRDVKDRKKQAVTSNNSKSAVTHFKVLERYERATLIEVALETGRTHQIRVHMDYIGFPIVNDSVYGRRKKIDDSGQMLHAKTLSFIHPNGEEMTFEVEPSTEFLNILNKFKDGGGL